MENKDELDRIETICDLIESTGEKEYIQAIVYDGGDFETALADLVKLRGFAAKMCVEYEDDVKEFNSYRVYRRYLKCIRHEIDMVTDHMASLAAKDGN